MIFNMLDYYNMIKEHNLSIIYSGPLWSDGMEGIAMTLKKRLSYDELSLSASQSVFSVFIEQTTNMLMYSAEKDVLSTPEDESTKSTGGAGISKGIFILGAREKSYFVQSGNVIKEESANLLKSRIDYINTLDKVELRKFYKEKMKSTDTNSESKGAGLGLIEIARRASSKIEYEFTPLEDGTLFYSMFVTIG